MPVFQLQDASGQTIGVIDLADGLTIQAMEVQQEPPAPPAPPAPPKTVKRMTEKAEGIPYEQYLEWGWDDNALVSDGRMVVELESQLPVPDVAPPLHPSVAQADLPGAWQPEVPAVPSVPQVPAVPSISESPVSQVPAVPSISESPVSQVPAVPSAPQPSAVPTPPDAGQGGAPHIPGREFMIKDVSFEQCRDKAGVWFDARAHGISNGVEPAYKQDGTFTKKRGVPKEEVDRVLALQLGSDSEQSAQGPAVPPPPAGAVPGVTNVPAGPQTQAIDPATIASMRAACEQFGSET